MWKNLKLRKPSPSLRLSVRCLMDCDSTSYQNSIPPNPRIIVSSYPRIIVSSYPRILVSPHHRATLTTLKDFSTCGFTPPTFLSFITATKNQPNTIFVYIVQLLFSSSTPWEVFFYNKLKFYYKLFCSDNRFGYNRYFLLKILLLMVF